LLLSSASSVIYYIVLVVGAILMLLLHILIHELGHYSAARWMKIKVKEFSVGFGPAIAKKTNKRGELVSLRAFPLGGYCSFYDEAIEGNTEFSFNKYPPKKRLLVLAMGGIFNIVSAILFSAIMLCIIGFSSTEIAKVYEGENNGPGGLKVGDVIVAIDDTELNYFNSINFSKMLRHAQDDQFTITVMRDGVRTPVEVTYGEYTYVGEDGTVSEKPYVGVGISFGRVALGRRLVYSVLYAAPYTLNMAWQILTFFGGLITGSYKLVETLGGPVSTVKTMADYTKIDWRNIFVLLPFIAVNLGVFNLLPIPALDGSKLIFTTIEWIRGKPVNRNVEAYIHFAGLVLLLGLVIVLDVIRLFFMRN